MKKKINSKVIQGNNIDTLKQYPDDYFDSIVTDPPYGIEFLGKDWDKNTGAVETWQECFRVLKPGGYLLAFSAARTYHHLATNIEGVGFDIRDQLMWLYASGFPKAQDIGKAIDKRGGMVGNNSDTKSLKKLLAKLFKESGKNNTQINKECGFNASGYLRQHDNGVDGWGYALPLNDKWHTLKKVLECGDDYDKYFVSSEREVIGTKEAGCFDSEFDSHTIGARSKTVDITAPATEQANHWHGWKTALKPAHEPIVMARKPFKGSTIDNVLTHGVGALNIDATRVETDDKIQSHYNRNSGAPEFAGEEKNITPVELTMSEQGRFPSNVLGEVEGYQKFFYCPKVSRAERHCGFEAKEIPAPFGDVKGCYVDGERFAVKHQEYQGNSKKKADPLAHIPTNSDGMLTGFYENGESNETGSSYINKPKSAGNNHPTVKPVELMKYLVKLVTPSGGKVLDPFTGSGSTGMAAVELDYDFTGCELDPDYVNIAETRINAWFEHTQPDTTFDEIFEEK